MGTQGPEDKDAKDTSLKSNEAKGPKLSAQQVQDKKDYPKEFALDQKNKQKATTKGDVQKGALARLHEEMPNTGDPGYDAAYAIVKMIYDLIQLLIDLFKMLFSDSKYPTNNVELAKQNKNFTQQIQSLDETIEAKMEAMRQLDPQNDQNEIQAIKDDLLRPADPNRKGKDGKPDAGGALTQKHANETQLLNNQLQLEENQHTEKMRVAYREAVKGLPKTNIRKLLEKGGLDKYGDHANQHLKNLKDLKAEHSALEVRAAEQRQELELNHAAEVAAVKDGTYKPGASLEVQLDQAKESIGSEVDGIRKVGGDSVAGIALEANQGSREKVAANLTDSNLDGVEDKHNISQGGHAITHLKDGQEAHAEPLKTLAGGTPEPDGKRKHSVINPSMKESPTPDNTSQSTEKERDKKNTI